MKKILSFLTAILFAGSMMATDYQKVTSTADLVAGAKYVIGTDAGSFIATTSNANNRKITTTTVTDGVVEATEAMMVFTLGGEADAWTFATDNYLGTAGYLNATSTTGSNNLKVVAALDDYAYFTIAIADGVTTITCNGKESRNILYQNGTTCFSCYNNQTTSQYSKPNLYKEVGGGSTPSVIYSVAGSKALLGAEWNEKEGNEMALDKEDGLYKLLCADVTLAAGTKYEFKIVTNHDWKNESYPTANKELYVEKDGKYDVTITFNADTKDVAYVAEFKGGAVVEKHYLIVGDAAIANGENWNNAADINLMKSADEGLTYTLVVENAELAAETPYGYKVVEQGSWTEYFPNIGGDNAYFSVEAAGVYTITYTYTVATSQCVAITSKTGDIPGPIDPPTPGDTYYMKNNWDGGEWTWKEMTQDGDIYKLENVVFGGTGVNYSTSMEDLDPAWVALEDILGDEIAALDTVTFVLNPVKATVTATLIGKYVDPVTPPTPEEFVTLYFVNVDEWENVYAYVWNDDSEIGALAQWPGTQMTITEDSVGDYAVYSFTFNTKYTKVIFDNGNGGAGNQTSDMIWNAATPYYYDGIWYASLDDINPAAETKFYISGSANLVGAGSVWDPKAIKSLEDSYTLHLQPGVYLLKISLDGTDATWKGFSDLSEITPGLTLWDSNNVIAFTLIQEGDVVVTYKVVNEVVTFTVVGQFYTIESGFYLISTSKDLPDLTAADMFAPNTGVDGEYLLNTALTEGDRIAVVLVANNAIIYYYYDGENFYYVDANHAGATTIYFRPNGNEEWTETGGYFYVVPTSTTGIEETIAAGKAAKVLRNGQILILKGDKMYNVMGAVIR